ncbi:MAG: radical SAM protein [Bacteroidales bacterium]|nr:radical SAM protein [Bacteroidales bacterium]
MLKIITNKSCYQFSPELATDTVSYNLPLTLFGKQWYIMDDYWMKHIHLKITDRCNAACPFCIEQDSNIRENKEQFLANVSRLLYEMDAQGHLSTVSITGGEPALCDYVGEVVDMVKRYCHLAELKAECIAEYRQMNPSTKIRIQCVLHEKGLQSIEEMLTFMEHYKGCADDFSFRRLITLDKPAEDDLLQQFKYYLFNYAELVEQVLKDYYVYETWRLNGILITLSHSNMGLLRRMEENEPDNLLREIVVHPDGHISGSWYRNRKVICPAGRKSTKT